MTGYGMVWYGKVHTIPYHTVPYLTMPYHTVLHSCSVKIRQDFVTSSRLSRVFIYFFVSPQKLGSQNLKNGWEDRHQTSPQYAHRTSLMQVRYSRSYDQGRGPQSQKGHRGQNPFSCHNSVNFSARVSDKTPKCSSYSCGVIIFIFASAISNGSSPRYGFKISSSNPDFCSFLNISQWLFNISSPYLAYI